MSPDKRCQYCTFWNVFYGMNPPFPPEGEVRHSLSRGYEVAECRKGSPVYELIAGRSSQWPKTSSSDWCGDFKNYLM